MTVSPPGTIRTSRTQRATTRASPPVNYNVAAVVAITLVMVAPCPGVATADEWHSIAHDSDVRFCRTVHQDKLRETAVNRFGHTRTNHVVENFTLALPGSFTTNLNLSVQERSAHPEIRLGMLKRWVYAGTSRWKIAANRWNQSWVAWTMKGNTLPEVDPVGATLPLWLEPDPDWATLSPIPDFTGQRNQMHAELQPAIRPSLKTAVQASHSAQSSSIINPKMKLAVFDAGKNRSMQFMAIGFLVAILIVPIGCSFGAVYVVPCARGSPRKRGRELSRRRREHREKPVESAYFLINSRSDVIPAYLPHRAG